MSLQSRLSDLITAIGTDVKSLGGRLTALEAIKHKAKVVDFDTGVSTTLTVPGLDGDAHQGYDVWMEWLYKNTSGDHSPFFRPNPSPAAIRCMQWRNTMTSAGATSAFSGTGTERSGTGIGYGSTINASTSRIRGLLTGKLLCSARSPSAIRGLFSGDVVYRPGLAATDPAYVMSHISGWIDMSVNLTALDFEFDNAPAAGRLILTPIAGSF